MTVLEVIKRGADYLTAKGVESARLQAELLLAHVLHEPRLRLYLDFGRELNQADLEKVRRLIQRRGRREPLQHLLGSASFCGQDFLVSPAVLIPRPETETLAESAVQFLQARPVPTIGSPPDALLDFGTGSGCLAVTLALRCPAVEVSAIDISDEALALARENASRHAVAARIRFFRGSAFEALPPGSLFDLIVANPPYIPSAEIVTLQPEVRDHDPRQALDGGVDGLEFMRLIGRAGARFLRPGGRLMLEFGDGQAGAVREILQHHGWAIVAVRVDLGGTERVMVAAVAQ